MPCSQKNQHIKQKQYCNTSTKTLEMVQVKKQTNRNPSAASHVGRKCKMSCVTKLSVFLPPDQPRASPLPPPPLHSKEGNVPGPR